MIFLASKGRVQTPKSLSFSMAVRQLTISPEMIRLLNDIGYSCSIGATVTYESDLASPILLNGCKTANKIPRND